VALADLAALAVQQKNTCQLWSSQLAHLAVPAAQVAQADPADPAALADLADLVSNTFCIYSYHQKCII